MLLEAPLRPTADPMVAPTHAPLSPPPFLLQLLMLAPLFCTMMAGPSGLLLYLALIRPWFRAGTGGRSGAGKHD